MKQLLISNKEYQRLLQGYENWLKVKGYSAKSVYNMPALVQGFLYQQEQQDRTLTNWKGIHYKEYMQYNKTRANQRRAGGLSSAHLNKMAHALEQLQKYLLELGQAEQFTPLKRLKNSSKPIEIFTQAQIKELYAACPKTLIGSRQKAMLGLCYGCGLRSKEAIDLTVKDLWWDKQLLQVRSSKTKKSRLVPIPQKVLEDLKDYAHQTRPLLVQDKLMPYFLLTLQGGKTSHGILYKSLHRLLTTIDLPLTGLHILRHSIASHLTSSGMKSEQVAQLLGHQSLDSTQLYVQLNTLK